MHPSRLDGDELVQLRSRSLMESLGQRGPCGAGSPGSCVGPPQQQLFSEKLSEIIDLTGALEVSFHEFHYSVEAKRSQIYAKLKCTHEGTPKPQAFWRPRLLNAQAANSTLAAWAYSVGAYFSIVDSASNSVAMLTREGAAPNPVIRTALGVAAVVLTGPWKVLAP